MQQYNTPPAKVTLRLFATRIGKICSNVSIVFFPEDAHDTAEENACINALWIEPASLLLIPADAPNDCIALEISSKAS